MRDGDERRHEASRARIPGGRRASGPTRGADAQRRASAPLSFFSAHAPSPLSFFSAPCTVPSSPPPLRSSGPVAGVRIPICAVRRVPRAPVRRSGKLRTRTTVLRSRSPRARSRNAAGPPAACTSAQRRTTHASRSAFIATRSAAARRTGRTNRTDKRAIAIAQTRHLGCRGSAPRGARREPADSKAAGARARAGGVWGGGEPSSAGAELGQSLPIGGVLGLSSRSARGWGRSVSTPAPIVSELFFYFCCAPKANPPHAAHRPGASAVPASAPARRFLFRAAFDALPALRTRAVTCQYRRNTAAVASRRPARGDGAPFFLPPRRGRGSIAGPGAFRRLSPAPRLGPARPPCPRGLAAVGARGSGTSGRRGPARLRVRGGLASGDRIEGRLRTFDGMRQVG